MMYNVTIVVFVYTVLDVHRIIHFFVSSDFHEMLNHSELNASETTLLLVIIYNSDYNCLSYIHVHQSYII